MGQFPDTLLVSELSTISQPEITDSGFSRFMTTTTYTTHACIHIIYKHTGRVQVLWVWVWGGDGEWTGKRLFIHGQSSSIVRALQNTDTPGWPQKSPLVPGILVYCLISSHKSMLGWFMCAYWICTILIVLFITTTPPPPPLSVPHPLRTPGNWYLIGFGSTLCH